MPKSKTARPPGAAHLEVPRPQCWSVSDCGYLYDGKNLLHETEGAGGVVARTFATATDEEYGDLMGEDGEGERYFQFDAQANVNAVVNGAGDVQGRFKYYAFGNAAAATEAVAGEAWSTLSIDQWADLSESDWAALRVNPGGLGDGATANLGMAGRKPVPGTTFTAKKSLTGKYDDDLPVMWRAIAEAKNAAEPGAGWTPTRVRDWLSQQRLSPHHSGGNTFQLIPWDLHGNPSATPTIPGVRHQSGAYDLRNQ